MSELSAAHTLLARGADAEALFHLKAALVSLPNSLHIHKDLVGCYYSAATGTAKWEECSSFYTSFVCSLPHRALRQFIRGEQLFLERKYDAATTEFIAAADHGLKEGLVYCRLGEALQCAGKQTEAVDAFEVALELDPESLRALHALSEWFFQEGYFGAVEDFAARAVALTKKDICDEYLGADAHFKSISRMALASQALRDAISLNNAGKAKEAVLCLWPTMREHRTNCPLIRAILQLFDLAGWLETGRRRMAELFRGEGPYELYATGEVLRRQRKYAEAREKYTAASAAGLDHPLVTCALAATSTEPSLEDDVFHALSQAFVRQPWSAFVRSELANAALGRSQNILALDCATVDEISARQILGYEVAGRLSFPQLRRLAVLGHMKSGDVDAAIKVLHSPCRTDDNAQSLLTEATAYVAVGALSTARSKIAAAIRLEQEVVGGASSEEQDAIHQLYAQFPEDTNLGLAFALQRAYEGDLECARDVLVRLNDQNPDDTRCLIHMARIAAIQGNVSYAKVILERVLEREPQNEESIRFLCGHLIEENDLPRLMEMANQSNRRVVVLKLALVLARRRGEEELARTIAVEILHHEPGEQSAICELLGPRAEKFLEAQSFVSVYCTICPLDFEIKRAFANAMLEGGKIQEARDLFEQLTDYGDRRIETLFKYALSCTLLASDRPFA